MEHGLPPFRVDHPRILGSGLGFAEGPALGEDGSVLFTSLTNGSLHRWNGQRGDVAEAARIGGGPSGIAIGEDDTAYVVRCSGIFGAPDDGAPGLFAFDGEQLRTLVEDPLGAPNDICFGPDGKLYFTDPISEAAWESEVPGRVHVYDLDAGTCKCLHEGLYFPNGLAFSPSGRHLYVAASLTRELWRFDLASTGELENPARLATVDDGIPDGLAVAEDGLILAAVGAVDGLVVFSPEGERLGVVDAGEGSYPTNLCFTGAERTTLVITSGKGLLIEVETSCRGVELWPRG